MNGSFKKVVVLTCIPIITLLLGGFSGVAHAVIVGVDIEAGLGSPANWTSYTLANVGTITTNLIAEDGSVTGLGFQMNGTFIEQSEAPQNGAIIPTHLNDLTTVL